MKGRFPEACDMCVCHKDKPEESVCCGCLDYGCPCGTTEVEELEGRVQCKACNCNCGQHYDSKSKLIECKTCYCEEHNLCECDTGCCQCGNCFPSTARVSLENGKVKTMSELNVGDRVQTGKSTENSSLYCLI